MTGMEERHFSFSPLEEREKSSAANVIFLAKILQSNYYSGTNANLGGEWGLYLNSLHLLFDRLSFFPTLFSFQNLILVKYTGIEKDKQMTPGVEKLINACATLTDMGKHCFRNSAPRLLFWFRSEIS